jgi:hypothetical protein
LDPGFIRKSIKILSFIKICILSLNKKNRLLCFAQQTYNYRLSLWTFMHNLSAHGALLSCAVQYLREYVYLLHIARHAGGDGEDEHFKGEEADAEGVEGQEWILVLQGQRGCSALHADSEPCASLTHAALFSTCTLSTAQFTSRELKCALVIFYACIALSLSFVPTHGHRAAVKFPPCTRPSRSAAHIISSHINEYARTLVDTARH